MNTKTLYRAYDRSRQRAYYTVDSQDPFRISRLRGINRRQRLKARRFYRQRQRGVQS